MIVERFLCEFFRNDIYVFCCYNLRMSILIVTNDNIRELLRKYINNYGEYLEEYGDVEIGKWDVSRVTDMSKLFKNQKNFNESLNEWNVSNVINMSSMFYGAIFFNQPLNNWDVSNVKNMSYMFCKATHFNQPLNKWDVSNVKNMSYMFANAFHFNQPLNKWKVFNVMNMNDMFKGAEHFNYSINNWKLNLDVTYDDMFVNCNIVYNNKPRLIIKRDYDEYNEWKSKLYEEMNVVNRLDKVVDKANYFINYKRDEPVIEWRGYLLISKLYIFYLKYKYESLIINNAMIIDITKPYTFDSEEYVGYFRRMARVIRNNLDEQIICFNFTVKLSESSYHANLLIYRREFNTIEHFEPHGSYVDLETDDILDNVLSDLVDYLNNELNTHMTFITSVETCPMMDGLQAYESKAKKDIKTTEGYCLLWVLFIIDLVLKFPTIPTRYIISSLLSLSPRGLLPYTLTELMEGYAKYVNDILSIYYDDIVPKSLDDDKINDAINRMEVMFKNPEYQESLMVKLIDKPKIKSSKSKSDSLFSINLFDSRRLPVTIKKRPLVKSRYMLSKRKYNKNSLFTRKKRRTGSL